MAEARRRTAPTRCWLWDSLNCCEPSHPGWLCGSFFATLCQRMRVNVVAPAKVNLHLQVLQPRPDGYHNLLSLFQAVSLSDELELSIGGPVNSLRIRGNFGFAKEENSIHKAVELFRAATGVRDGLEAAVVKRIPAGGGMGGGSSDAAATLVGLQALFNLPLPTDRLHNLGLAVGSDIPFFFTGAAAVVEGRGETVTRLDSRSDFAILCVFPGASVSTAAAYRGLDDARTQGVSPCAFRTARDLAETYRRNVEAWDFFNDFDDVVRPPEVMRARCELEAVGVPHARLTGSGATLIVVFSRPERARETAQRLTMRTEVVTPLAFLPHVE